MSENSSPADTGSFEMGRVALTVHDLPTVSDYYQKAIGLHLLSHDGETARLGAGDVTLLELRQDKHARQRSSREAGLYHTAFLLPERGDLAAWTQHAIDTATRVAGASDHAVSEAIYLQDPEGNGIEIYADRPNSGWKRNSDGVAMGSDPLDVADLLSSRGDRVWTGFTQGSKIGHVHLQVGNTDAADAFYRDLIGLDITARYPGASFFSANGYHHHIAANTWHSRDAGKRDLPSTGLTDLEIIASGDRARAIAARAGAMLSNSSASFSDPWATPITLTIA